MIELKVPQAYFHHGYGNNLPAKAIPELKNFFKEPGIFVPVDLEDEDYVGISHQIMATEEGYDVI